MFFKTEFKSKWIKKILFSLKIFELAQLRFVSIWSFFKKLLYLISYITIIYQHYNIRYGINICFSFVLISQNELKSVLKCLARFHADGIAFLKKNSEAKYPFLQVHTAKTLNRKFETNIPRNETARPIFQFPISNVSVSNLYTQRWVLLFCCRK